MPEGPEIRRAADALAAAVVGAPLNTVWFDAEALKPYECRLRGRRIEAITPHGKALLTHFDNGLTLYSHNQLYGLWRVATAGQWPQTARPARRAGDRRARHSALQRDRHRNLAQRRAARPSLPGTAGA